VRKTERSHEIRVLLAEMPRMLIDIVKSIIASQLDFALAGEISGQERLLQAAIAKRADVIVVGALMTTETSDYRDLLYRRPRTKIIAIAADGRHALLHELQPHVTPLDEVSPASLIAAIRGASHPDGGAIAQ
jgi:DNA-binding NarL/FixJ family response regulator